MTYDEWKATDEISRPTTWNDGPTHDECELCSEFEWVDVLDANNGACEDCLDELGECPE